MVQTIAEGSSVADVVSTILSVFSTIFSYATNMVTENWVLFLSVGVPIVAGVVFAIVYALKGR